MGGRELVLVVIDGDSTVERLIRVGALSEDEEKFLVDLWCMG